jgi:heat shock protein HslJ
MKNLCLVLSITLATISCNNGMTKNPVTTKPQDSVNPMGNHIMVPVTSCYASSNGKEIAELKLEVFPNVVTGTLSYQFHEKDRNKGTIEGKLTGDTLLANYTFLSEGVQSIRQVIFLVRDSVVFEGYGAQQLTDGKMIFKNLKEISFGAGTPLKKVSCDNAATQGGSELLFASRWNLAELKGTAVGPGNAHLLFYPGKLSTVSGNAGCNNLKGSFELQAGGKIKFSPMATTRKACAEPARETEFIEVLGKADGWMILNNQLLLKNGETVLATLNPAPSN